MCEAAVDLARPSSSPWGSDSSRLSLSTFHRPDFASGKEGLLRLWNQGPRSCGFHAMAGREPRAPPRSRAVPTRGLALHGGFHALR